MEMRRLANGLSGRLVGLQQSVNEMVSEAIKAQNRITNLECATRAGVETLSSIVRALDGNAGHGVHYARSLADSVKQSMTAALGSDHPLRLATAKTTVMDQQVILAVLEANAGLCMDNDEERKQLASAIIARLQETDNGRTQAQHQESGEEVDYISQVEHRPFLGEEGEEG